MEGKLSEAYRKAGVDVKAEDEALRKVVEECHKTFSFREGPGKPVIPIANFAGIVTLTGNKGLAVKTDGVGTKVFIAQLMDKYDTVGIDCVAMNVNDLICLGAEPITFIDYIALQKPDSRLLHELAKGLVKGAEQAGVTIVGGEIAQLPEMIRGQREGFGFDLVGMAVGLLDLDKIIDGRNISEGDVVIGLESSGIHSNGLTLARKILLEEAGLNLHEPAEGLDKPLGEELLTPTRIYVKEVLSMLRAGLKIKGMAHLTGKGILNLGRVGPTCGYLLEWLPEPQPIFKLIQKLGKLPDSEMYQVFNMGVGFCLVVEKEDAEEALSLAEKQGLKAWILGKAVRDPERKIVLKPKGLTAIGGRFI
ncbi:MAG: phosphoribosylformylglycinamidine cyclo-ligase [Candidatus Hecatellales archaeon]|nr:MAG: phosphoribosylformylglycinamidine cyclo-ligase [Candidatus Hecatellales archaeon]